MGARFLSNPHFHMEIVKIDGYYKAFCQNRWVQLDISQNRWVQLHPLTHSNEGPVHEHFYCSYPLDGIEGG